jgi:hypothetical protein
VVYAHMYMSRIFLAYFTYFEKIEYACDITFLPVCVCVCLCIPPPLSFLGSGSVKIPLSLLGSGLVETLPRNEYTRNNRRIVGRIVFSVACVISREVGD